MRPSSSASEAVPRRVAVWPLFPFSRPVQVSLWVGVVAVAALFAWGAWQRRWIADDGLIVLRTVRNLLAGNGPVFNVGERVESNTSTVWTYLVYLGGLAGGPVRLEYVALALALALSVAGVVLVMLGAARLYAPMLQGRRAVLLPAGVLVYISVPPARDFATSGLENGLVTAYLGLLWWMMVCWSQALVANVPEPGSRGRSWRSRRGPGVGRAGGRHASAVDDETVRIGQGVGAANVNAGRSERWGTGLLAGPAPGAEPVEANPVLQEARRRRGRAANPAPPRAKQPLGIGVGGRFLTMLAFVAGLSVLVRPELALIGGLALVMMLVGERTWKRRVLIVFAGGLVPVAYQIFRMGYYALLVPGTAVAKDASGSKWSQGWAYLLNFNQPYLLWLPAVSLVALAVLVFWACRSRIRLAVPEGYSDVARAVQHPAAVVAFMVVSGLLQAVYWIRQGGDFMHGRVLLTPLFCLLAPVAVIPVVVPDGTRTSRWVGWVLAGCTVVVWLDVAAWSLWAANSPGLGADATKVTYSGIVDERRFYAQATGHAHPLTAMDYLDYPRMRAVVQAINDTPRGALLLPSGNYTQWDVVPAEPPPPPAPGEPPEDPDDGPHTVFFTNLGMLGMNVGLDVRVIDQIGLANPLAMHTARLEDGRIGHDKNLFPDWAVAEGPWMKEPPFLPAYLDEDWVRRAEVALQCPATDSMLNAIRGPLTLRRFGSNILHSAEFTKYRIDRVPEYELIRCGLSEPELRNPPYKGLPAMGP